MKGCYSSGVSWTVEKLTVWPSPSSSRTIAVTSLSSCNPVISQSRWLVIWQIWNMLLCDIAILFIGQRLHCCHGLDNHWPLLGYTFIFSTDVQSDQKVIQPDANTVLCVSKNYSYDCKCFSFVRFIQFMHGIYMIRMKLQNLHCLTYLPYDFHWESSFRDIHGDCDQLSWMFSTDSSLNTKDWLEHLSFTLPVSWKHFIKWNIVDLSRPSKNAVLGHNV
jgi:hypothetical protein